MFKAWEGGISSAPGCRDLRVLTGPDAADVVLSIDEWDSRESHQSFVIPSSKNPWPPPILFLRDLLK